MGSLIACSERRFDIGEDWRRSDQNYEKHAAAILAGRNASLLSVECHFLIAGNPEVTLR
jgi:hypothetical protein